MISSNAQASIEGILLRAARSRLPQQSDDACDIVPLAQGYDSARPESNVIILTISSILFRLLLVFHFDDDASTRDHFVKNGSEVSLQDALLEICNLCCGAVNQDLLRYFPDLGMSTPYVLSARCLSHLEQLKPDYLSSYAITINGSVQLAATVCVCAHAPIDFVANMTAVEESSGELELF
ncbi:hypothetical protein M0D69_17170 [Caballeronia sp. SEWSISQ10-4 2]|uniref:hypothetical protein n=1 Tax=Caballeronia sp. SEWSISQ10-4 2 TaxID=2937438 RepID=UPI00264B452E|nr:hypothetical protein [Caballeronia sp. SEWSISQ10-4 2]MDN7179690.1 hypothetical protein [Caballeronia sp. SEWSISQ10-4 2]